MRLCERIGLENLGWPVVVDIQNIHDYWMDHGRPSLDSIVAARPPWPAAFLEARSDVMVEVGILAQAAPVSDSPDSDVSITAEISVGTRPLAVAFMAVDFEGKWTDPMLPGGVIPFDESGAITGHRVVARPAPETPPEAVAPLGNCAISLTLMTYLFANCKNVTIRDHTPTLTRQQRRHGPPAITYKVLDIVPMMRVLHDEGDIEHNGLKKALHICRGHFAHYGPDAKLFGKYEGTFWHPMHTRGSVKNGVVVKDYKVSPHDPR